MPITVELQDMHSYSIIMIVVAAVLMAAAIVTAVVLLLRYVKRQTVRPVVEMTVENRRSIKEKYYELLYKLEIKCHNGKISNRKAYQELSKITRHFVYEATGIKVHNYTLQEIKRTNISGLYDVISECYAPEFALNKNGEIFSSIAKARKVIEEWS